MAPGDALAGGASLQVGYDVVVVGSGGAGVAAALAAAVDGAVVGTKGGPCTDANAQVLDWESRPIAGLFAAGNAAASVIGTGILSSGLTLGLALTWGWLAGTAAATNRAEV